MESEKKFRSDKPQSTLHYSVTVILLTITLVECAIVYSLDYSVHTGQIQHGYGNI